MKRRTFLGGLISLPVLGHAALSDEVPKVGTRVHRSGIYRALITANSGYEANEIWTAMSRPADIKIVGPGAALGGIGTEMLLLAHDFVMHSSLAHDFVSPYWIENQKGEQWVNHVCRPRLLPGAPEVIVSWDKAQFDWNTKTGLAASFVSPGHTDRRQAFRIPKPMAEVSYTEWVDAKAALFKWYLSGGWPS